MMRSRADPPWFTLLTVWPAIAGMLLLVPAVFCQDGEILITKSNGSQLRVPTTGPLADSNAQTVAKSVRSFDAEFSAGIKRSPPGGTTTGANPEVLAAMQQLALESRNEAVDQLDLAYQVAQGTSAVSLNPNLVQQARQGIERARKIISSPPPSSLYVHTEIAAAIANGSLHYMAMMKYRRQSTSWESYEFGKTLPIGLYMFRLDAPSMGEPYEEEVLVLAEPTEHKIIPLPK